MLSVFLQASAPQTLNPWQLVIGASPVVQLVMLILLFMGVMCLYIIGAKWIRLKQVTDQSRSFLELFWSEEESAQLERQGAQRDSRALRPVHAVTDCDRLSCGLSRARAHCANRKAGHG